MAHPLFGSDSGLALELPSSSSLVGCSQCSFLPHCLPTTSTSRKCMPLATHFALFFSHTARRKLVTVKKIVGSALGDKHNLPCLVAMTVRTFTPTGFGAQTTPYLFFTSASATVQRSQHIAVGHPHSIRSRALGMHARTPERFSNLSLTNSKGGEKVNEGAHGLSSSRASFPARNEVV